MAVWLLAAAASPIAADAASSLPWRPGPERLARAVGHAEARVEGTGGPVLNVFFDPRCAACLGLMRQLRPWIDGGTVTVRWIAVQATSPNPSASEAVRANTALLALLSGGIATPTLAYQGPDGVLHVQVGHRGDLRQLLEQAR